MSEKQKNIQYGFINTFSPDPDPLTCSDEKCGRSILFMNKCFIDQETGYFYCEECGKCKRYERKMKLRREALGIPETKINGE